MKKYLSMLLVLALCLSFFALTACGSKDSVVIDQPADETTQADSEESA